MCHKTARQKAAKKAACHHPGRPHSIYCIVPPYVLDSIARNGTPQERADAMDTLSNDATLRTLRVMRQMVRPAPGSRRGILMQEGQKQRTIYDAQNDEDLSGVVVRREGDPPTGDLAVDEAYEGLGATYDLFWDIYARNSIDDEGLPLDALVHYGESYNNAFWNGERMVFGDGDGQLFNRFTIALDVISHELTHGVTEDESGLIYLFQPGAINESISDVFGSLVKQRVLNQTAAEADWLIGAGLFTDNVNGEALRSMKAPGTAFDDPVLGQDPQPGHMDDYVRTFSDNGGVHINSGIPNRAFYTVATNLGGYAWEAPGFIWYATLRDPALRSTSNFQRFARLTVENAARLYGVNSTEQQAVIDGWNTVGISA